MRQAEISRLLGVTCQKVYYWAHTDFKMEKKRRKKFNELYVNEIAK